MHGTQVDQSGMPFFSRIIDTVVVSTSILIIYIFIFRIIQFGVLLSTSKIKIFSKVVHYGLGDATHINIIVVVYTLRILQSQTLE